MFTFDTFLARHAENMMDLYWVKTRLNNNYNESNTITGSRNNQELLTAFEQLINARAFADPPRVENDDARDALSDYYFFLAELPSWMERSLYDDEYTTYHGGSTAQEVFESFEEEMKDRYDTVMTILREDVYNHIHLNNS